MRALRELGLESHPAAQSESSAKEVLQLWDADGDGGLNISEFTKWASDARAFREADVPSGDNKLDEKEFVIALKSLGVDPPKPSEVRDACFQAAVSPILRARYCFTDAYPWSFSPLRISRDAMPVLCSQPRDRCGYSPAHRSSASTPMAGM